MMAATNHSSLTNRVSKRVMARFHESRILGIAINYAITHLVIFLLLLMIDTGRKE